MSKVIRALAALSREIEPRQGLEAMLTRIVEAVAALLKTPRVSVRLLDAARTRLLAVCRAGEPLHLNSTREFRLGEGLIGWVAQHAAPLRSGAAEQDPRFALRPDMREPMGSFLGVPLIANESCIGVLAAIHPAADFFTEDDEALLAVISALCAPHVEIARLLRLSQVDALTGALNRHGLELAFPDAPPEDEWPVSVAMVDVDRFKLVNDTHGHAVGDEVLRRVAHILSNVLRAGDAIVRYGGEEFLLILSRVDLASAGRVADRARAAVEKGAISAGGAAIGVTISLGVAERRPGEARAELIARADAALYAAKQAGRNRVELSS
jgi:diguanylate cyclase (GGDEF)-like protein